MVFIKNPGLKLFFAGTATFFSFRLGNSLAGEGIHALVHHHDAHAPVILASSSCSPTHLDILPTLDPPAPKGWSYAYTRTDPFHGCTAGSLSICKTSVMTWHSSSTAGHSTRRVQAEQSRAEQSRAEQSRAEQSRAEHSTSKARAKHSTSKA